MVLITIFVVGYAAIVFEHALRLNKAAAALLTGVFAWTAYIAGADPEAANEKLAHHLGDLSQVLFFLLAAMTIVEVIDAHDGFEVITSRVKTTRRRALLAILTGLAFFLSAVLDNLTTSIVMMSLVRRLVPDDEDRMTYAGVIIIAANAGGVWSPIGDVTTTMLWVGKQITTTKTMGALFFPALVSVAAPALWIGWRMKGELRRPAAPPEGDEAPAVRTSKTTSRERSLVFFSGLALLLFVPVFKTLTHLPPVMGILLGLGALWTLTEVIHKKKDDSLRGSLTVSGALQRVDAQSILFFLGILLAITALESDGKLGALAAWLDATVHRVDAVTLLIGLSSSIVDNVPLVAAAQGMYPMTKFPTDHSFWLFLAYCAGTGGSILIIGSAAGVAVMGLEKISFGWYFRRMSLPALLGYVAGAIAYLATS
ncbi:MAG: sodium:proton antiporter NhaD [Deltaproteobacteria bacterium]|nr:sodium:proton antiporter NhaD [Deltaproteobacteria bacterium]